MGSLDFDASTIQPSAPLDVLPSGTYLCKIADTEKKQTKSGTGEYLMLTLDVLDPQYRGRKVFDRLNLWNPNQQAVDIAKKTLSAICHSINLMQVRNHEELRGKTLNVKVTVRNDPNYDSTNEVKGYSAAQSQESAAPASPATAVASGKPW